MSDDPRTAADRVDLDADACAPHGDTTATDMERAAPAPAADAVPLSAEVAIEPAPPPSFRGFDLEAELPPRGTRWRWFHVAPGFAPLLGVLLLTAAGVPQRILGRLHGSDPMEGNDTIAEARAIEPGTHADLSCRYGDVDWFRLQIPAGRALAVSAKPGPEGQGEVSIHDLKGPLLARGIDACTYMPPGLAATEVAVRVWGGRRGRYTLKAELVDPRTRFEQNDLQRDAAAIKAGRTVAHVRCDGRDWFSVEVPRWRPVVARLVNASGVGLHLIDGQRDTASGVSGGLPQTAKLGATRLPRRVYVEVVGQGDYDLKLELGPLDQDLVAKSGQAPLPVSRAKLEPNQSPDAAAKLEPGRYPDLQLDGVDYYRVRVPADTTLQVEMRPKRRWARLNLASTTVAPQGMGLGVRRLNTNNGAHLLFHQDRAATLMFALRGNARYEMKVRMTPGAPGTLVPPGEYPNLQGQGDDLWRIDVLPGQTVVTEVVTRRNDDEDYYGSDLRMELIGQGQARPLKQPAQPRFGRRRRRPRRPRPFGQRALSTNVHGIGTLRYTARQKESLLLRVSGVAQAYDLHVKLQGNLKPFRPRRAATLVAGTFPRRVQKPTADTHYRLALKRDEVLVTAITFDDAKGDLDLELLDEAGMRLTQSANVGVDEERIRFRADRDRVVYLRVSSTGFKANRYDLVVTRDGSARPASKPLRLGKRRRVCSGSDHYRIKLQAGQRLRVRAAFDPKQGDLDLAFLDGSGTELTTSTTRGPSEALTRTAPGNEELLIRVTGKPETPYELTAILDRE